MNRDEVIGNYARLYIYQTSLLEGGPFFINVYHCASPDSPQKQLAEAIVIETKEDLKTFLEGLGVNGRSEHTGEIKNYMALKCSVDEFMEWLAKQNNRLMQPKNLLVMDTSEKSIQERLSQLPYKERSLQG